MSYRIESTSDGSNTLYSNLFDATYHSIFGAIEESIHVFLAAGLDYVSKRNKHISILEIGFGTGLNAWLTYIHSLRNGLSVNYSTLELYPVDKEITSQLNFHDHLPCTESEKDAFDLLHALSWDEKHLLDTFSFIKHHEDFVKMEYTPSQFDCIYFDAFAPSTQPELWELDLHTRLYKALKPGGCLVTYCAKGDFKRLLKSIGYMLDPLNGPNRKHEMTRAIKA